MDEATEFARIIACKKCSLATSAKLLRDEAENIPQPGYVGRNYLRVRVLLIGQNPGVDIVGLKAADMDYTAALRALRDQPTAANMTKLRSVLDDFIPQWPVHGSYFPLKECGLNLSDIAYFNVVRCRTTKNAQPGKYLVGNCSDHLGHWLAELDPKVVIFIGKWAHDNAAHLVSARGVPHGYMNRDRSLSTYERKRNRDEVVSLVRSAFTSG